MQRGSLSRCCRHGVTHIIFWGGTPAATIANRGRRASLKTLTRYLTNGRAVLMPLKFSTTDKERIIASEQALDAYPLA